MNKYFTDDARDKSNREHLQIASALVLSDEWREQSQSARAVYPVIGVFKGKDNKTVPIGYEKIAALAGVHRDSAIVAVKDLVSAGLITSTTGKLDTGRNAANTYHILNQPGEPFIYFRKYFVTGGVWRSWPLAANSVYLTVMAMAMPVMTDAKILAEKHDMEAWEIFEEMGEYKEISHLELTITLSELARICGHARNTTEFGLRCLMHPEKVKDATYRALSLKKGTRTTYIINHKWPEFHYFSEHLNSTSIYKLQRKYRNYRRK